MKRRIAPHRPPGSRTAAHTLGRQILTDSPRYRPPDRTRLTRRRLLQSTLTGAAGVVAASVGAAPFRHTPLGTASARAAFPPQSTPVSALTVSAWLYSKDTASVADLEKEAHHLTAVCPTWYTIGSSGSISSDAQAAVIRLARERGVALVPLFRNAGFDPLIARMVLESPGSRRNMAGRILALVLEHDYAGANIDFEGPFGAYRDKFTDFTAQLATLLHAEGKQVTVNVGPQLQPLSGIPVSSWAAPYDYRALAQVCDAVVLMAYSKSDQLPGSLSPLWWVRDATAFAREQVASGKLVVGQSFYGRHWIVNGSTVTHTDLTQEGAEALLARTGAPLLRPASDATPRFTWQDSLGRHIVHYEDGVSLGAKLQAVLAHGVAGFSFWRLGQEKPTQWDVIARLVHGHD